MTDWAARIGRHITSEGSVVVPPRIAHWLEQKAGVTSDRRIAIRDTDPEAYEVLAALHLAALQHRSDLGTKRAGGQGTPEDCKQWLTTAEAANEAGVTDRCIRNWITRGQLPATRNGWQYLIDRTHLNIRALAA
jgi:excisionase family DNA binding protein